MKPDGPTWVISLPHDVTPGRIEYIYHSWRERYSGDLMLLAQGCTIKRIPRVSGGRPGVTMGLRR